MFFILIYLGLCIALAQWAKAINAGSAFCFFISLLFTPLAGLFFIIYNMVLEHDVKESLERDAKESNQNKNEES